MVAGKDGDGRVRGRAAPAAAETGGGTPAASSPTLHPSRRPTRREVTAALAACGVALVAAPPVAAGAPRAVAGPPGEGNGTVFEERYRGRLIRGVWIPHGTSDSSAGTPAASGTGAGEWQVTVDGRPLHLMRRADGTWLSMVDHYQSYRTPLEAARGAVDVMGPGQQLRDLAPGPADGLRQHPYPHAQGVPDGVRA
ncbi:tyrosinase family oxidase copper chaperone [Streptomyces sp. WAC00469]|uniref:tyrosinase family oxidase copper chaperone n=1 Tax=Streptomyces sp. WAC00469 TaxID=2487415 RepID=UPI000F741863|nr:tyrosinase family oxidase copper chaperone [Streptomyces sp. WAC00469]RSS01301.1 tyrosinase [Streptomyces sp. WAC00469]